MTKFDIGTGETPIHPDCRQMTNIYHSWHLSMAVGPVGTEPTTFFPSSVATKHRHQRRDSSYRTCRRFPKVGSLLRRTITTTSSINRPEKPPDLHTMLPPPATQLSTRPCVFFCYLTLYLPSLQPQNPFVTGALQSAHLANPACVGTSSSYALSTEQNPKNSSFTVT